MSLIRQSDPWQRFCDLLPDAKRRGPLIDELTFLQQNRGVDFDKLYEALCYVREASDRWTRSRQTLKKEEPWLRRRQTVRRQFKRFEESWAEYLVGLTDPLKEAFRTTPPFDNPYSTTPTDLATQKLEEMKTAMGADQTLTVKRPEGRQPKRWWLQEAHKRLKAAGVGFRDTRDQFLRLYGAKPYS